MTAPLPRSTRTTAPPTGPTIRHCQYCGQPAEVHDVDGAWCSSQCQTHDRQSEATYWRKAVDA